MTEMGKIKHTQKRKYAKKYEKNVVHCTKEAARSWGTKSNIAVWLTRQTLFPDLSNQMIDNVVIITIRNDDWGY